ncbi:MAG: aminopeptidase [Methanobacteriales archaeon Met13]
MDINKVLNGMQEEGLDSMFVVKPENITYLTGYYPSSYSIFILIDEPILLVPKLDLKEAEDVSRIPVEEFKSFPEVMKILSGKIGVDPSLPMETYLKLSEKFEVNSTDLIATQRMIKTAAEIRNIQKAIEIAERSLKNLKMCGTENEMAAQLEYNMRCSGSIKPAFETIIASGKRSSFPHASVSSKKVTHPVVIDWGAVYNHYASDTTRTLVQTENEEEVLEIILEAQKHAIKQIKPGVKASYIDKVARDIITEYGYGDSFLHSTGHGVGLEVHEIPSLSFREDKKLETGMVITVEPGIYLENDFGVRVEDMILIKKRAKVLNKMDSKLSF